MRSLSASLLGCGAAAAVALTASSVFAHIDLHNPMPRYAVNRANGGGGSKECPCGGTAVDPDRICNVPAAQSHDPNRSANVTTLEAGSKLTISVEEYIDHSGRFRVAFDADGADMTDFNSKILLDVADDKKGGMGVIYDFEVTLPDMTCENCTLQILQDMNGRTAAPVADPSTDSVYYTCADIRLVPKGTMGGDDGMDPTTPPGAMPPGNNTMTGTPTNTGMNAGASQGTNGGMMGGALPTVPQMGDNTSGNGTTAAPAGGATNPSMAVGSLMPSTTGSMPSGMPTLMNSDSSSDSSGGCSLGSSRTPASPFAALTLAGAFALLAGRRRRVRG